jgi:hypothetical protein
MLFVCHAPKACKATLTSLPKLPTLTHDVQQQETALGYRQAAVNATSMTAFSHRSLHLSEWCERWLNAQAAHQGSGARLG